MVRAAKHNTYAEIRKPVSTARLRAARSCGKSYLVVPFWPIIVLANAFVANCSWKARAAPFPDARQSESHDAHRRASVHGGDVLTNSLFHVAIKTRDLGVTRRFYVDVLGMTVDARPAIGFPGIWLRNTVPGGHALFHIYAGDAAREPDGSFATGTGVIDHVSLTACGYEEFRERFRRYGLRWRENILPDVGLWQLFVYDPSGVMLELTFTADAERIEQPQIAPEFRYHPRENFFHAEDYMQFAREAKPNA